MATLDDAIMEHLEKGWISAESAYVNCIDKGKFVKFLKSPPTDFTEA
jgi:twitching motility protein PilT